MNIDFKAGSTPITSRQNPVIYLVILATACAALAFIGMRFILLLRKKKKESPEFQKKERERPTRKKDVARLAAKYKIREEYIPILWYVCRTFKVPNIYYSIRQFDRFDDTFKEAYLALKKSASEDRINQLFRLKFYLDRIFAESEIYTSTRSLPPETKFSMLLRRGNKIPCTLLENTETGLSIEIPLTFYESSTKPEQMDRIAFSFKSRSGMPHAFVARILRYEKHGERAKIHVSHSKEVMTRTQRNFKRIWLREDCRFTAVTLKKDADGNRTFIPGNKKYSGKLTNLSGGGCCIASNLPIKEGQSVGLEFDLSDGTIKCVGVIVKSRKTGVQGVYNLHIKYLRLDTESQNKILAKVYGYQ